MWNKFSRTCFQIQSFCCKECSNWRASSHFTALEYALRTEVKVTRFPCIDLLEKSANKPRVFCHSATLWHADKAEVKAITSAWKSRHCSSRSKHTASCHCDAFLQALMATLYLKTSGWSWSNVSCQLRWCIRHGHWHRAMRDLKHRHPVANVANILHTISKLHFVGSTLIRLLMGGIHVWAKNCIYFCGRMVQQMQDGWWSFFCPLENLPQNMMLSWLWCCLTNRGVVKKESFNTQKTSCTAHIALQAHSIQTTNIY